MEEFFARQAETYEEAVPIMKNIARNCIALIPPITSSSIVLDNACGPGTVTGEIMKQITPGVTPEIHAVDLSVPMIEQLKKKEWASKVQYSTMDAQELKYPDDKFTHSFTNFVVMALPKPVQAAKEVYRTLKPGATAVFTTWKELGYMSLFHSAQKKVRPDSELLPGPRVIPSEWMGAAKLRSTLEDAGFQSQNIEVTIDQEAMSSMWGPGLDLMKGVITKDIVEGWTEIEQKQFGEAFEEQIAHEKRDPHQMQMVAWIAVARK